MALTAKQIADFSPDMRLNERVSIPEVYIVQNSWGYHIIDRHCTIHKDYRS